jgi:oligopeptide/dipeptide ABC transporter ATP-binding protein
MLLDVDSLWVTYGDGRGQGVRAVRGVSFGVEAGDALGIVGESGCGKSSVANAIVGLAPVSAGTIRYRGEAPAAMARPAREVFRRRVQVVFQDPLSSLNPRLTVGQALIETLYVHRRHNGLAREARRMRCTDLLESVGLNAGFADRYPHQLSGGQRQRVGIARALATDPEILIADEPVSALDVSIQAQILNVIRDLAAQRGLVYILIAHDLAVVRYMCRQVLVMYHGAIVERGPSGRIFDSPVHPYTEALLSAVPDMDRSLATDGGTRRIVLSGEPPSATSQVAGCPFHTRCHRARAVCAIEAPMLREVAPGHASACHFAEGGRAVGHGCACEG